MNRSNQDQNQNQNENRNRSLFPALYQNYYKIFPDARQIPVSIRITADPGIDGTIILPNQSGEAFGIVLNSGLIKQYTDDHTMRWLDVFARELTRAVDHETLMKELSLVFYQALTKRPAYKHFQLWGEYHASRRGYQYFRQFFTDTDSIPEPKEQLRLIEEQEWPFHKLQYEKLVRDGADPELEQFALMRLLGRYAVWCGLFPEVFYPDALTLEFYGDEKFSALLEFLLSHDGPAAAWQEIDAFSELINLHD